MITARERESDLESQTAALGAELEELRDGKARFELYEDRSGRTRWRLRHRNGDVIADGGQGYASRSNVERAIDGVKRNAPGADVDEQ